MVDNSTSLDILNYTMTLNGWVNSAIIQPNVSFSGGSNLYQAAFNAYTTLVNDYNWTITPTPIFLPTPDLVVQYNQPTTQNYNINSVIQPYTPAYLSNFQDVVFSVLPALPDGLTLDPATGTISGTPTEYISPTNYTITTTANQGSVQVNNSLTFSVVDVVNYFPSSYNFVNALPITPITPTVANNLTITSYAISPVLPSGLIFNPINGFITGTPILGSDASYVIIATYNTTPYINTITIKVENTTTPVILQFDNAPLNFVLTLPLIGVSTDSTVQIDWGDGTPLTSNTYTYNYNNTAITSYIVNIYFITGNLSGFGSADWIGSAYLSAISGWDNLPGLLNLNNLGGAALTSVPNSLPLTVRNISNMFSGATQFNQDLSIWDVSQADSMNSVFLNAASFNQPLNTWDVSQVINMTRMFSGASMFNQDLSGWDVRKVTSMTQMFDGSLMFNQSLNNWQVGNVADMSFMFKNASRFNQPLNTWQVGNVVTMTQMFNNASRFNQDLSAWDVSQVADMSFMFRDATMFNKPLTTWNVGKVVTMASMFDNAINFNQPLNNWNVSQVVNMSFLFFNGKKFNQDLSAWNVSRVIDMRSVFSQAASFNQDLSSWDVSSATQMSYMFYQCRSFNQNLGNWNVRKVTTMDNMFTDAASFDVSNYSATLMGWAALPNLQINVPLAGGSALYEAARAAYTHLITAPYVWQITPAPTFLPTPALSVEYNQSTTRAYKTNTAILPYQPTVYSTYSDVFFSITPALPAGLTIDASNGTISGTPTVFATQTTYTVNATANAGQLSMQNILRFSVSSDFYYPSNSVFLNEVVINPLEPIVAAGITITSYAITPNLSAGLNFNTISGAITGTPRDASLNQIYTITGTNANGTTLPYVITLNVVDIRYANVPYIYAQNAEFLYSPFNGYPIIPTRYDAAFFNSLILKTPLPVELAIDLSDGIIYGIPYTATPPKNYILTATTISGYTKDITLSITVDGFSYTADGSEPVYSLNVFDTVKIMLLINVGGYTDFIVTPKLPAGLTLDSATGTISGAVKEQPLSDEAYFISGLVDPIITIPITIIIKAYNPPVCEYKCPPRVIIPQVISTINTNTMRYSTLVRIGLGQTRFIANSGTNINATYTEPIRNKF